MNINYLLWALNLTQRSQICHFVLNFPIELKPSEAKLVPWYVSFWFLFETSIDTDILIVSVYDSPYVQDVLKPVSLGGFTGYPGVPNWLSAKFRPPAHPYPWPMYNTSRYSTWACGYFAEEISNGFQQLYQEHKTEFANFWRHVALR